VHPELPSSPSATWFWPGLGLLGSALVAFILYYDSMVEARLSPEQVSLLYHYAPESPTTPARPPFFPYALCCRQPSADADAGAADSVQPRIPASEPTRITKFKRTPAQTPLAGAATPWRTPGGALRARQTSTPFVAAMMTLDTPTQPIKPRSLPIQPLQ
jgi:hypothetical protein